jgi:serine/threonine protein kinase
MSTLTEHSVRANAFHLNAHSGHVRLVHFGNRAISLEKSGAPTKLVIQADVLDENGKARTREALCYLAPEQMGSSDTNIEDHRTDIYSLGILFWTLIVGRGALPFEGTPMQVLHDVVQRQPNLPHEVRRDVPQVVSKIIAKVILTMFICDPKPT